MTGKEVSLVVGELVWGKVDPHPWWPGKITSILQQNSTQVFKISFFADPTYSYLHCNHIRHFSSFYPEQHIQHSHPTFRKALELAQKYEERCSQQNHLKEPVRDSNIKAQESREEIVKTLQFGFCEDNYDSFEKEVQTDHSNDCLFSTAQITLENVVEMIQQNRKRQKKGSYSYEQRKEHIKYQEQLKHKLLEKYKLSFSSVSHNQIEKKPKLQKTPLSNLMKTKLICKEKGKSKVMQKDDSEILRIQCLRKIGSVLRGSQNNLQTMKEYTVKLMRRVVGLAEGNRMKLQSLFVTLLKSLSSTSSNLKVEERLGDFSNYLDQLQSYKIEDDGSKITQVEPVN